MIDPTRNPDTDKPTGRRRWIWVVGIVAILGAVVGVILMLTGGFGGEHTPGPPPGGH